MIPRLLSLLIATSIVSFPFPLLAAPVITRLTPPSNRDARGTPVPPVVARFLPDQRFDLRVEANPDTGRTLTDVQFFVDGERVDSARGTLGTRRAYSNSTPGIHTLRAVITQSDGQTVSQEGIFEIVDMVPGGLRARNIIVLIGDGMGVAHRTAARVMLQGVAQGKSRGFLSMDTFSATGMVITHSLNSIITDSSPGSHCYSTGNKANNNQHGVFPDNTTANFDNPRIEHIGEYLKRTRGVSLGLVTTSDVFDATPAAWATHTQSRAAGTGIVDQYFDERDFNGLTVLMGGGRKWFLPNTTPGSARSASTDYVLPGDLSDAYGIPAGRMDPGRDLIADFTAAGFAYAGTKAALAAVPASASRLLGLFSLSNMNVALDKIEKRRNPGAPGVVDDYGFPDQPMLDEMTEVALRVLEKNRYGFVLMVEGASIDKQAHNMDTERWILDTIEFDRAVAVCKKFAEQRGDTIVVVTADHECAGVNLIGATQISNAELRTRAAAGGGAAQLRDSVVGTYESAGFPNYTIAPDGYPTTTDVDRRLVIGYAANADRNEDWLTNAQPLRDGQQPFNGEAPLNTYPSGPVNRDEAGRFLITGQVADSTAVHTASDIPLSAFGRGALLFTGVQDNTDVFFKLAQLVIGGTNVPDSIR